jgi:antitoxin component YwqK of YwqJK toxin-antitoxin module
MARFILLFFILFSCTQNRVPGIYINASRENINSRGGLTYYNGKIFSGWSYKLFPDGDTIYLTPYLNGKEEGTSKLWYENRQLKEKRFYRSGKKNGEHLGWYSNGSPRFIYHYQNDLYQGNVKEWRADGLLYRNFNYESGHESGLQKMWEADGRLKANYEVRNGRKYGLTGSKNCLSASR